MKTISIGKAITENLPDCGYSKELFAVQEKKYWNVILVVDDAIQGNWLFFDLEKADKKFDKLIWEFDCGAGQCLDGWRKCYFKKGNGFIELNKPCIIN